jgi:bifunctional non-homologous end joining protein LigD
VITPMVARLVRDPFDREGWLFELKWDGFRAIAETDHSGDSTRANTTIS